MAVNILQILTLKTLQLSHTVYTCASCYSQNLHKLAGICLEQEIVSYEVGTKILYYLK